MTTQAIDGVSAAKPTRARLFILALITAGTMINYLDRTVISVAAPLLSRELHLDAALMGIAFSAFSWTYAAAQIPGGMFLDRFGVLYDECCMSPHRSPRALAEWMAELEPRGIEVVVAGSGGSAALAGIVAAHVAIPVIGVPLSSGTLDGHDALFGLTQLPVIVHDE